jgi:hypothetical protein
MARMTDRISLARSAACACALIALALPAAASATPVSVNLRIEGRTSTLFDGPVTTDGHDVTTAEAGTHRCDGTNGNANPTPGPTPTAALDDVAKQHGFTIDGNYGNFGIDDYFLDRIAGDSLDPNSEYWSLWINFGFADLGGCQQRIHQGEDVLWGYAAFSGNSSGDRALKLTGPASATTGAAIQVKVANGADGTPESGARVGGTTTGPDGSATLAFPEAGVYRLKAEHEHTIRSNSLVVCVDPAGAAPCTSGDHAGPRSLVLVPRFASTGSRSRTFTVAWQGDDGKDGSGVSGFTLDGRDLRSRSWKTLMGRSTAVSRRFRGKAGQSYEFRVSAFDRANNRGPFANARVSVPFDDADLRLSKGWKRVKSSGAWGGKVVRSSTRGATARMSFTGRRVALIGRKLPRGGRLLLTIDGHRKRLRLRGKPKARSLLYLSAPRKSGRHRLSLRALGGGPVEIDAVSPVR